MKTNINTAPLEEALHYTFQDKSLLKQALTLAYGKKSAPYERLEFLGDRVVGLTVSEWLFHRFPKEDEGDLAKRFTALVKEEALAEIAQKIHLGDYLITNEPALKKNSSVLSDVVEALMAVIFMESGFENVKQIIHTLWKELVEQQKRPPKDAKTRLQEYVQKKGLSLPVYQLLRREGPDHQPVFFMSVLIDGFPPQTAQGPNKHSAEQACAESFLETYVNKDHQ